MTTTKKNNRLILALCLLIGPTVLMIICFVLIAIVNLIYASTIAGSTAYGTVSPVQMVANFVLVIVVGISTLAWLPGIIVGIILLATKPQPR